MLLRYMHCLVYCLAFALVYCWLYCTVDCLVNVILPHDGPCLCLLCMHSNQTAVRTEAVACQLCCICSGSVQVR